MQAGCFHKSKKNETTKENKDKTSVFFNDNYVFASIS